MLRAAFLRRMAFAALACGFLDLRTPGLAEEAMPAHPAGVVVLWGDGVTDDVVGLETLLSGGTVWDAQTGAYRTGPSIFGGQFACSRPVRIGGCKGVISHSHFRFPEDGSVDYAFDGWESPTGERMNQPSATYPA